MLSLVSAIAAYFVHPESPKFVSLTLELSLDEALALEELQWVDARIDDDYYVEHYPDSVLLNEEHWEEQFSVFMETWIPEVPVVVYCSSRSCARSHEVARRLREELGVDNVFALSGGWEALKNR